MLAGYIFSEHARSGTTCTAHRTPASDPFLNEVHMTRHDWWIGIVMIVVALLLHAAVLRYEWRQLGTGGTWSRADRWSGALELWAVRPGQGLFACSRRGPLRDRRDRSIRDPTVQARPVRTRLLPWGLMSRISWSPTT
jgi:hypothetical protein